MNLAALHPPINTGGNGEVSIILIRLVSLIRDISGISETHFQIQKPARNEMFAFALETEAQVLQMRDAISSSQIDTCAETSFFSCN